MPEEVAFGPWLRGMDTFHDPDHAVFQKNPEVPERLLVAENVALETDGWWKTKPGRTALAPLTNGLGGFSGSGHLLVQDGGELKRKNPADWTLITVRSGLDPAKVILYEKMADRVYWTNGTTHGCVLPDGGDSNWGMIVPDPPVLGTVFGALPAGRYRVTVSLLDAQGVESGAPEASAVVTDGAQDIQVVSVPNIDPDAVSIRIFVTGTDAGLPRWQGTVDVGSLPATISFVNESTESTEPVWSQHLRGPIQDIEGLSRHRGFLLAWKGKYLMHTDGIRHHLFNLKHHVRLLHAPITGAAGVLDGCFVTTERGAVFYAGEDPEQWRRDHKDERVYAKGHAVVPGSEIPFVQTNEQVALFVSEDGLAIGLPGGTMIHPHKDQHPLDVAGKRASIILAKPVDPDTGRQIGINQILFTLE